MKCRTYTEFVNAVGLIDDPKQLNKFAIPSKLKKKLLSHMDSGGAVSAYHDTAVLLKEVTQSVPELHVITQVDSDDGTHVVYDNSMRFVNRNCYHLGHGDSDESIFYNDR